MNLRIDKREQEHPVDDHGMQNGLLDSLNEDREQQRDFPVSKFAPAKKGVLGPIIAAVLVFAAALVIVYYGFYKKSIRLPFLSGPKSTEQTAAVESLTADEDNVVDSTVLTTSENSRDSGKQRSCIQIAPEIMNSIAGILGPEVRLNALFFDEGSFSAEINAPGTAEATTIYNSLSNSLSSDITLTSSPPRTGQNALLAGVFVSNPNSGAGAISSVELEQKLRDIAEESLAIVASVNISSSAQGQTVFLKLDGTFDDSRQFLQRLSQLNLGITVSKLLLMPGQNNDYSFVLRFYL